MEYDTLKSNSMATGLNLTLSLATGKTLPVTFFRP